MRKGKLTSVELAAVLAAAAAVAQEVDRHLEHAKYFVFATDWLKTLMQDGNSKSPLNFSESNCREGSTEKNLETRILPINKKPSPPARCPPT